MGAWIQLILSYHTQDDGTIHDVHQNLPRVPITAICLLMQSHKELNKILISNSNLCSCLNSDRTKREAMANKEE